MSRRMVICHAKWEFVTQNYDVVIALKRNKRMEMFIQP